MMTRTPVCLEAESIGRVAIHRISTTRFGRSGLIGRGFDYLSFYTAACRSVLAWAKPGDVLVAKTDPPLLSVAAMRTAKRRGLHLVNWLQDLYPEIAVALGVPLIKGPLGRGLLQLRDASLRAADVNVVVGERMAEIVRASGISPERVRVIPNWCDDDEIQPIAPLDNPLRREWGLGDRFVVGYSGNLGRAHECETVLAAAERLRRRPAPLLSVYRRRQEIRRAGSMLTRERGLDHLFRFLPYQERRLLKLSLGVADVHLISLRPELEGLIVPSKLYGIAAAGRPIIAVAASDGEIATLVRRHDCGVVIEPGDGELLADTLRRLRADHGLSCRNGPLAPVPCSMPILPAGKPSSAGGICSKRSRTRPICGRDQPVEPDQYGSPNNQPRGTDRTRRSPARHLHLGGRNPFFELPVRDGKGNAGRVARGRCSAISAPSASFNIWRGM